MPKQIQLRRGTTAQHATFTGALGEVTMDTEKKTVVVHDAVTPGGWPLASALTNVVLTGALVWVDAVNGRDVTGQRGQVQLPFQTLTAAKAAAVSGDTVLVLPGTYNEKNLARNGVNWHFVNGAVVSYAGGASGGIFDTTLAGGACTFMVSGQGVFKVTSENTPQAVVKCGYSTDNLRIECDRIEGLGPAFDLNGTVLVRCNELKSASATCITSSYGLTNATIYAHKISSSGGQGLELIAGTLEVIARYLSSSAAKAIRFVGGTLRVSAAEISSSVSYGVEYAAPGSNLCRIDGARIVSTAGSGNGIAVYVSNGSGGLRFANCAFVGTAPASYSLSSGLGTIIYLHNPCVANLPANGSITLTGSALTVNANLT